MENLVRSFVLDEAVGLLQSLKTRLPPKTSGDIESGLLNAIRPPTTDGRLQHYLFHERSEIAPREVEGSDAQGTILPSTESVEQSLNLQQQFTEGPPRFIMANDGSKDCMALLVPDDLIAPLRDLYEDSHHLSGKQGPLDYARREARRSESSIHEIKQSIEATENQETVQRLREMMQQQERRLLKFRQRRDKLEEEVDFLKRTTTSSKAHIQWSLDTAMKEANLLEPHRPLTPVALSDIESGSGTQEEHHQKTYNEEGSTNGAQKAIDNVIDGADLSSQSCLGIADTDDVPEELQSLRRAALESYDQNLATIHQVRTLFDNRQQSYETDLEKYQQGFANGIYNISRSEFDRSKLRFGQKVTRALIDTEEAFEAAKEEAQAVGAIGSDYEDSMYGYGCYEESWPEDQLASYLATKNWNHVHKWLANLSEPTSLDELDLEPPEVDDWYADEVDPADSISQIDFDDCRRNIDRWEDIRFGLWEDMRSEVGGPEVQVGFLARSIEDLKRRHSVSLCRSDAGEWENSI